MSENSNYGIMTIGKNLCPHDDRIPKWALSREAAGVDLRGNGFDDDAFGCCRNFGHLHRT